MTNKHDTTPHVTSIGVYLVIYIALMVLLAITVTLDFYLVGTIGLLVAMGIAIVKGLLVVLYFMHLRDSSRLTWVFASAAFLWLAIMAGLTLSDYLTRPAYPQRILDGQAASVQGTYTQPARIEGTGFNLEDEGLQMNQHPASPAAE